MYLLQKLIKPSFGSFEDEELKKFLRMGCIFALIIASCWTLGTIKNAIFCTFVSASEIPWGKTASLLFLIPVLMIYTKLVDIFRYDKVFYIFATFYALVSLLFSLIISYTQNCNILYIIGYAFFIFVESYIALIPAIFWAIASDTTKPDSAKKGYSLIVAIGQLGGIFGPYFIAILPRKIGFVTGAVSIFICALIIFTSILLFKNFFKKTPKHLLESYHGQNEEHIEKKEKTGFLQGIRLLINNKYLLAICAVVTFPEIIMTIFDIHFNSLAAQNYTGIHLVEYLGKYGSSVNIFAFLFLILGIGNITRFVGIGLSLILMPIIYTLAIAGFITLNSLPFLFILMSCSKAINYALNGPAIKQLYIPTTHAVRFKAQSWIESFGLLSAKQAGSIFNMSLNPLQSQFGLILGRAKHALFASYLGFSITFLWFFIALFLGKKYKKAIIDKKFVA